eukprot:1182759-Alexandrium_andersonii.AAC.1
MPRRSACPPPQRCFRALSRPPLRLAQDCATVRGWLALWGQAIAHSGPCPLVDPAARGGHGPSTSLAIAHDGIDT